MKIGTLKAYDRVGETITDLIDKNLLAKATFKVEHLCD